MNLITKKLRNITDEEFHDWSHRECDLGKCINCIFYPVNCDNSESSGSWLKHKDMYSDKFLDQIIEVRVPDILTNEEKEYLSTVIKPFRDRIISIAKIMTSCNNREAILITYTETYTRDFRLPDFPKDTMYKNMSNGIAYKPEELGL